MQWTSWLGHILHPFFFESTRCKCLPDFQLFRPIRRSIFKLKTLETFGRRPVGIMWRLCVCPQRIRSHVMDQHVRQRSNSKMSSSSIKFSFIISSFWSINEQKYCTCISTYIKPFFFYIRSYLSWMCRWSLSATGKGSGCFLSELILSLKHLFKSQLIVFTVSLFTMEVPPFFFAPYKITTAAFGATGQQQSSWASLVHLSRGRRMKLNLFSAVLATLLGLSAQKDSLVRHNVRRNTRLCNSFISPSRFTQVNEETAMS